MSHAKGLPALIVAGLLLGAAPPGPVTGRSIMEEVDRRRRSEGQSSEGIVTVEEKGKVRRKAWRSWRLGWGPSVRSLIQFLEPAEVRGVGLLTLTRPDRADEQWFYVPSIDRERRIAPQEKTTRFIGTHFTYEDFEERVLDDEDYTLRGEESVGGAPCWRIEARPRPGKGSQYSSVVLWIRKDLYVTAKMAGYVGGELRRTFTASDIRSVDGILTAHRWEVVDAVRGGRTILELRNVRYPAGVDPGLFTIQGMKVLHEAPQGGGSSGRR